MTPEEIQRQAAARNSAGQLGEARQRALPAPSAQPAGTAVTPAQQARPAPNALATAPQPRPEPITGTAKPVPRPQPTITVDSQGNAATQQQRFDQAARERINAQSQARLDAMRRGGIGALDEVVSQQRGLTPAPRANLGAAPAAPAAAAPAPAAPAAGGAVPPAGTPRPGIVGRIGNMAANTARGAPGVAVLAGLGETGLRQAFADTDRYAERFGADIGSRPPGAGARDAIADAVGLGEQGRMKLENVAEFGRDVLLRSGGALTDFGAAVGDGLSGFYNMSMPSVITGDIPSIRERFADEQPGSRTQRARAEQAAPGQASSPPAESQSPAAQASRPAAQPQQPEGRVLGTINGREVREQPGQGDALGTSGLVANPNNLYRRPDDNGQGQLLAMLNQSRSDRMNVQSGANDRLEKLYERFNDQIAQGRRRTAAVIGEQIRAELGVLGQTAGGQMIDPRRPDNSAAMMQAEAEVGRLGEVTAGQRMENQRAQRLAALEQIITDPEATEERRAQAATLYQQMSGRGGQQQPQDRIVDVLIDQNDPLKGTEQARLIPGTNQFERLVPAGGGQQQPGLTMIGTSGGKPVYRDAQGNTFIDE
jgi:hypothetical protein